MKNKGEIVMKQSEGLNSHSLNFNQIHSLLSSLGKELDLLKQVIVIIFLFTGVRVSELLYLKKEDVMYCNETIVLRVHSTREISRYIPLNSYAYQILNKYLNERTDENEYLFVTNKGVPINIRKVQSVLSKYNVNSIQLRHTFRSELLRLNLKMSAIVALINGDDSNESSIESLESLYQGSILSS